MTEETRKQLKEIAKDFCPNHFTYRAGCHECGRMFTLATLAYELGEKAGRYAQKDEDAQKLERGVNPAAISRELYRKHLEAQRVAPTTDEGIVAALIAGAKAIRG